MSDFKLGDMVTWESQAGGRVTIKTGKIVAIVPEYRKFCSDAFVYAVPKRDWLRGYAIQCDGIMRNHESYFVEVAANSGRLPKLYHPRVSNLKLHK